MRHQLGRLRQHIRRPGGFTLIELMVVVALIGIFSVMAITSLPFLESDTKSRRARNVFAAMVREARGRALANRAYVALEISTTGNGFIRMCEKKCAFDSANSGDATKCLVGGGTCSIGGTGGWTAIKNMNFNSQNSNSEFYHVKIAAVPSGVADTIIFNPRGRMEPGATGLYMFVAGRSQDRRSVASLSANGTVEVR